MTSIQIDKEQTNIFCELLLFFIILQYYSQQKATLMKCTFQGNVMSDFVLSQDTSYSRTSQVDGIVKKAKTGKHVTLV